MKKETPFDVLIEGCLRSDRRSQGQLYDRFHCFAMGICLRYATDRNEAAENMNTGFQKVFLCLEKYESERHLRAWIGRIMINASIDNLRARARRFRLLDLDDLEIGGRGDTEIDLDYKEMLATVQQLPKVLRKVFNLWAIEGYTHKEIGSMLGKSEGTCKFHLFQAREVLQRMLRRSRSRQSPFLPN